MVSSDPCHMEIRSGLPAFDPNIRRLDLSICWRMPGPGCADGHEATRKIGSDLRYRVICLDAANVQSELMLSPSIIRRRLSAHAAATAASGLFDLHSGSTGVPKGVLLTHVGIPSLARSHVQNLNLTQRSRVLQFASLSFDASFWELIHGAHYREHLWFCSTTSVAASHYKRYYVRRGSLTRR